MNTNKIFAVFMTIALMFGTSCKKELTEDPKAFVSPENFFKTDADAVMAVNGAYFWLVGTHPQRLFQQELWSYLDEDCDAIFTWGNKGALNLTPINGGYASTIWNGLYRGIQTSSQVIDRVSKSGSSPIKDRAVAEARFLRALYYYYVTGVFRDGPLVDEVNYLDNGTAAKLPRTPADKIRDFMIKDLEAAIKVLPDSYEAANKGRATKAAAQTLLTKVFLWKKNWTAALTTAQAVTGRVLLPEYKDVFTEANEFNNESIFEIDFQKDNLNSYQHAFYSPQKKVGVSPFSEKPWYGGYVPLNSFVDGFEAGDKRKDLEIATGYMGKNFIPDPENGVSVWFGPKWWRLDAGERNSGLNIIIFRYADVLLMEAEAANEAGDQATAFTAINKVRARAGLSALNGLTQELLRAAIMKERGIELCGEGHRKLDLVRWGLWLKTAKAAQAIQSKVRADSYQAQYEYLPVPAVEVEKNPALAPQNQGY
ncbi:hypothetical protein CA265_12130 [Sphingobacteriaceae bacterium GW460-11-11-14-LB5]|nr:hypothetical protein CA265_12130 [Sphingobacteriaceae bacterium GW460-11-11-14-LB5]